MIEGGAMQLSGSLVIACGVLMSLPASLAAQDEALKKQATEALRRATEFFRTKVATEGGYLWRYSEDLTRREGEGKAAATQAWVQPPGTPSVGLAYLRAYQATGDKYYLDAARETALALVKGQLRSGGWDYRIEFDSSKRKQHAYRIDPANDKGKNSSTLDDNTTQEAVRLLMRVDDAFKFSDKAVHDAAGYALNCLLKAQYPNGAWPQRYDSFPEPDKYPVKKASFPDSWSREFPAKDYRGYYTLNDNTLADVVDVLLEAGRTYREAQYGKAVERAGDFLLLAQLPDPQPGWAQQYDFAMQPAWARKFEPPAVTGGESQGVMRTLLRLYRETGDKKYLEPLPRALDFYRRIRLDDGRLARFYELKTSKPLYFTKDYKLTYSDADLPTHYGFKVSGEGLERIAQDLETLKKLDPAKLKPSTKLPRPQPKPASTAQVRKVIADLDAQGRWVEEGRLRSHGPDDPTRRIIECRTFIKNLDILSSYLAAAGR
jgi:PelA/Pel-15E family pectate lyase